MPRALGGAQAGILLYPTIYLKVKGIRPAENGLQATVFSNNMQYLYAAGSCAPFPNHRSMLNGLLAMDAGVIGIDVLMYDFDGHSVC